MKDMIKRAKYVTEWDEGETVLESSCKVDMLSHEILHIGNRKIIQSPYKNSELDDCVEELWEEYVKFPDGSCADVVDSSEEWSFDNKNGIAPFYRGKNCYQEGI